MKSICSSVAQPQLFATPQTATPGFPILHCLFTLHWSLLKLKSIELVMHSNHLILCHWEISQCWLSRVAITKYHKLTGFDNRNLLSQSSRGQNSRSKCRQGHALSEGTREERVPGFLPSFLQFADFWRHNCNLHMAVSLCPCVSGSKFPLYRDTNHNQLDHLQRSYFQIKSLSLLWEFGLQHLLWGHNSAHDSPRQSLQ